MLSSCHEATGWDSWCKITTYSLACCDCLRRDKSFPSKFEDSKPEYRGVGKFTIAQEDAGISERQESIQAKALKLTKLYWVNRGLFERNHSKNCVKDLRFQISIESRSHRLKKAGKYPIVESRRTSTTWWERNLAADPRHLPVEQGLSILKKTLYSSQSLWAIIGWDEKKGHF